MPITIFPSENDIAPTPLGGKLGSEANFSAYLKTVLNRNYVVSGFEVTNTSAPKADSGEAIIGGRRVAIVGDTLAPALTVDDTWYLYLTVDFDVGGKATGASLFWDDDPSEFTNGVLLAVVVRSGGTITSITDVRQRHPRVFSGTYTGNGSTSTGLFPLAADVTFGFSSYAIVSSVDPFILAHSMPRVWPSGAYAGAGLVYQKTSAGALRPEVLVGSTTWDPPSVASGAESSTTVTVTGALVGQPAIACLSSLTAADDWSLRAFVTSTNTVTAVVRKLTAGSGDLGSGTLIAYVFKQAFQSDRVEFVTTNDGVLTPKLVERGFFVKHDAGTGYSLNVSGKTYAYTVIF